MSIPSSHRADTRFAGDRSSSASPGPGEVLSADASSRSEEGRGVSVIGPLAGYEDAESLFPSEATGADLPPRKVRRKTGLDGRWLTMGLAVLVLGQAAVIVALASGRRTPPASPSATAVPVPTSLRVESPAAGAAVFLDGRKVGATPITIDVTSDTRSISVAASTAVSSQPPVPAPATTTPLAIPSNTPADRITTSREAVPAPVVANQDRRGVAASKGASRSTRAVQVAAGGTAAARTRVAAPTSSAGWVSLAIPFEAQVTEASVRLGTSAALLKLSAGRHYLDLASSSLGFRTDLVVDVPPDRTVTMNVPVPKGTVSIYAVPWADIFLDGQAVGSTPIANLEVPLGTHEVVWRHPQLAERRQTVLVTARLPVQVVMDLNK